VLAPGPAAAAAAAFGDTRVGGGRTTAAGLLPSLLLLLVPTLALLGMTSITGTEPGLELGLGSNVIAAIGGDMLGR